MNNPKLITTAFAELGDKNPIPESVGSLSNSATWQSGFPPVTMTSKAAGGLAPRGQDMNGVLYDVTSNLKHLQSGGVYQFDSSFAAAIGGYSKGALVYNPTQTALYQSLIDGNVSPLTTAASWSIVWRSSIIDDISGKLNSSAVVQNAGNSTSFVMSQKATTDAINAIKSTAGLAANGWHKDNVTGMIIQWGRANRSSDNTRVNFPIPFPTACYSVQMTLIGTAGTYSQVNAKVKDLSTSSFIFSALGDEGACYWLSIGR